MLFLPRFFCRLVGGLIIIVALQVEGASMMVEERIIKLLVQQNRGPSQSRLQQNRGPSQSRNSLQWPGAGRFRRLVLSGSCRSSRGLERYLAKAASTEAISVFALAKARFETVISRACSPTFRSYTHIVNCFDKGTLMPHSVEREFGRWVEPRVQQIR